MRFAICDLRFMILALCVLFILCGPVQAAQIIRYVDPDATGAANGTSWTDAYTSLSIWEAAENQDLTDAGGDYMTVYCRSSAGTDDPGGCSIVGWTTGSANYIEIIGSDFPATGIFDGTKYNLNVTNWDIIACREEYVRFDSLQFVLNVSGTSASIGLQVYGIAAPNDIRISNCIFKAGATMTGTGGSYAILLNNANAVVKIWNCVIYGFISASNPTDAEFAGYAHFFGGAINIYNCTVFGCNFGIKGSAAVTVKNCAVFNNTDDFSGAITIDYCASDDGDGTNAEDFTAEATDWNLVFTDYTTGNVTLKNYTTSPCCVGQGTDDPGAGLYSDDITGAARGSVWDIGAFEYVATGGAPPQIIMAPPGPLDSFMCRSQSIGQRPMKNFAFYDLTLTSKGVGMFMGNF